MTFSIRMKSPKARAVCTAAAVRRRVTAAVALGAAVALVATGCGGQVSSADLPTTMSDLVKQAKQEGEVYWVSWLPESQMEPVIKLFEKKYPGIDVKYTNIKAPDQISQIKTEQAARKVSIDVANAGGLTMTPAVSLASDVDWSKYGVGTDDVFAKNFVYIFASPKVWAYNTTKVKPADVPKSWDDLLDPKWSGGKISAESRASFMTVWDIDPSLGETKGLDWATRFAAQKPHYATSLTQSEAPIETGEVSVGTSLANLVLAAQDKGVPVQIAPISPTTANKSFLYVPKGAPHPAAGALLTSFLSSDEAQSALAKVYNSRIPGKTDCSDPGGVPVLRALCKSKITWTEVETLAEYNKLSEFYPKVEKAFGTDVG